MFEHSLRSEATTAILEQAANAAPAERGRAGAEVERAKQIREEAAAAARQTLAQRAQASANGTFDFDEWLQ